MSDKQIVLKTDKDKVARQKSTSQWLVKARQGDQKACDELFALLEEDGNAQWFTEALTGAERGVLDARYGKDLVLQEAYRRRMKRMRTELGEETASPLEKLLIERIVLCWHHLQDLEQTYYRGIRQDGGMSLEKSTFFQKALDRAQKRHLAAIQSLALVRRLQIPPVQVNIAEKQMNVVQGAPPSNALPPANVIEGE